MVNGSIQSIVNLPIALLPADLDIQSINATGRISPKWPDTPG
jgi:hypothetical protein